MLEDRTLQNHTHETPDCPQSFFKPDCVNEADSLLDGQDLIVIMRKKLEQTEPSKPKDLKTPKKKEETVKTPKAICNNKNFTITEDVMIISAYYFYLAHKGQVRLVDITNDLVTKLNRSLKSVKKRLERFSKVEDAQIKTLCEYYERYKGFGNLRKIVLSANGTNMFLCSTENEELNEDEKNDFNSMKKSFLDIKVVKEEKKCQNTSENNMKTCDDLTEPTPYQDKEVSLFDMKTDENDIEVSKEVAVQDELAEGDVNQEENSQSHNVEDYNQQDCGSEDANSVQRIPVTNLLTLNDIINIIDTNAARSDREKARMNYLVAKTAETKPKKEINQEFLNQIKNLEINDPLDIIHTAENDRPTLVKISDINLFNIVTDYPPKEERPDLGSDSEDEITPSVCLKPKKEYIVVSDRDFLTEGYTFLKKRHTITEIIGYERPIGLKRLKKIKNTQKKNSYQDIIIIEPHQFIKGVELSREEDISTFNSQKSATL